MNSSLFSLLDAIAMSALRPYARHIINKRTEDQAEWLVREISVYEVSPRGVLITWPVCVTGLSTSIELCIDAITAPTQRRERSPPWDTLLSFCIAMPSPSHTAIASTTPFLFTLPAAGLDWRQSSVRVLGASGVSSVPSLLLIAAAMNVCIYSAGCDPVLTAVFYRLPPSLLGSSTNGHNSVANCCEETPYAFVPESSTVLTIAALVNAPRLRVAPYQVPPHRARAFSLPPAPVPAPVRRAGSLPPRPPAGQGGPANIIDLTRNMSPVPEFYLRGGSDVSETFMANLLLAVDTRGVKPTEFWKYIVSCRTCECYVSKRSIRAHEQNCRQV